MSAPVDVLTAIRDVTRIARAASYGLAGNVHRIARAEMTIAAVAELIAADEAYDLALASVMDGTELSELRPAKERRAAAIAACKGQQL